MKRTSRLELVVAGSAVFISLASFWLAWKQTDAMDAQVKAMSWPYLQINNGNIDVETGTRVITYAVENAGVGPTRVAWFVLEYDGKTVANLNALGAACCLKSDDELERARRMQTVTGDPSPTLMPAGSERLVFRLEHQEEFDAVWNTLDRARWKLSALACHCSILDQCWVTDFNSEPTPVARCPAPPADDWSG